MPYAVRRLPEAETEARAAAVWYERQRPGLGLDFLDRVERAVAAVLANPFRHSVRFGDVRRAPVSRFRFYGIYYYVQCAEVVIISVFHDRQHPARLRDRRGQVI